VIELPDVTVALESPSYALPAGCRPGLSSRIAAAEALQLIGGFSDPKWLVDLAPQFARFREPNGQFWGAYGPRTSYGRQLAGIVDKLHRFPDTRQAVVTLWDPALDNEPGKLDYPCTVAVGFSRGGRYGLDQLNMRVTMRSNDVWLGLPYDLFQFAQLQWTLCTILDLLPGTYTHTAWSMHLYRSDLEASYGVVEPPRGESDVPDERAVEPGGIGRLGDDLTAIQRLCRQLAYGEVPPEELSELRDGDGWFYDAIHG